MLAMPSVRNRPAVLARTNRSGNLGSQWGSSKDFPYGGHGGITCSADVLFRRVHTRSAFSWFDSLFFRVFPGKSRPYGLSGFIAGTPVKCDILYSRCPPVGVDQQSCLVSNRVWKHNRFPYLRRSWWIWYVRQKPASSRTQYLNSEQS